MTSTGTRQPHPTREDEWAQDMSLAFLATSFDSAAAFSAANTRQESAEDANLDCGVAGISVSYKVDAEREVYIEIAGAEGMGPTPPRPVDAVGLSGANGRRSVRRQQDALAKKSVKGPYLARLYKPKNASKRYHARFNRISTRLDVRALPHAGGGSWIGLRTDPMQPTPLTLDYTVNTLGFTLVRYVPGQSCIFTDKSDCIVGGLLDKPQSDDWGGVVAEAARALRCARFIGVGGGTFALSDFHDRRGNFLKIPVGISISGGQTRPGNLYHHIRPRCILARSILHNKAVQRIAGVQSSGFAFLNPKLYAKYCEVIGDLHDHHNLETNFVNSIFPASSFNCGPETVSLDHFDFNNLSYGFCGLTPVGEFDYTRGGHLILFELKLVVEFPPGTTALIPSAAVRHANAPIQKGEERMSIAQYAAGGIFRWVAYGFKTGKALDVTASGRRNRAALNKVGDSRWLEGLNLYSTAESLERDQQILF